MAKRRWEKMVINGRYFDYDLKSFELPTKGAWDYGTIYDAYERPSTEKINAWNDWYNWFYNCGFKANNFKDCNLWISSRNTFQFTISGTVVNPATGEILGIRITRDKNICWSISE